MMYDTRMKTMTNYMTDGLLIVQTGAEATSTITYR